MFPCAGLGLAQPGAGRCLRAGLPGAIWFGGPIRVDLGCGADVETGGQWESAGGLLGGPFSLCRIPGCFLHWDGRGPDWGWGRHLE